MKTAIVGSRTIMDYSALKAALRPDEITEVISGGAAGADSLAERWATEHNKPLTVIKPDYAKYGRVATMVRNDEIVKQAERVIAFWDGKSAGTKATIEKARKAGKPITVITAGPDTQLGLF